MPIMMWLSACVMFIVYVDATDDFACKEIFRNTADFYKYVLYIMYDT